MQDDKFSLFDLRVVVDKVADACGCDVELGAAFTLSGCKLKVESPTGFCIYALQSTIPLLPAKQRENHPADWMESDSHVVCPGESCGVRMKIERTGKTEFSHDDVSQVKWCDVKADK